MAMKKDTKTIIYFIIGIIILYFLVIGGCDRDVFQTRVIEFDPRTDVGGGEPSLTLPAAEDRAIIARFFDANGNEIGGSGLQSLVFIEVGPGEGTYVPNVFFLAFDIRATLTGFLDTTVWIDDIKITDADGDVINPSTVNIKWGCMKNVQEELTQAIDTTLWQAYGASGCSGDNALLPTSILETVDETGSSITQPLLFSFKLDGYYDDILGFRRDVTRYAEIKLNFTPDEFDQGGFAAEIQFIDESFIEDCDQGPPAEERRCPKSVFNGSACTGTNQSCSFGLWPGCGFSTYEDNAALLGRDYTGSQETGTDWKTICTDNVDNDCDGFADKGGCTDCGGEFGVNLPADVDCPPALVSFRTSAPIATAGDDADHTSYNSAWIVVDKEGDGVLESYGRIGNYGDVGDVSGDCSNTCPDPVAFSSKNNNRICDWSDSFADKMKMYIVLDATTCRTIQFFDDDADRCFVGKDEWPACLAVTPTSPWNPDRETHIDY